MYESGENYLETILMLHQKQGYVRSIDIANELGFTKPSVSRAMSILKNDGYIVVESSGNIVLTEKGSKKANEVYERHLYITKFLQKILNIQMCIRDRNKHLLESPVLYEPLFCINP